LNLVPAAGGTITVDPGFHTGIASTSSSQVVPLDKCVQQRQVTSIVVFKPLQHGSFWFS